MDIEVDFSLRHVEIFEHTTYLPIAFTDSFRYFFAYRPPLVAINAAVAMAIERTRKISLPDSRF